LFRRVSPAYAAREPDAAEVALSEPSPSGAPQPEERSSRTESLVDDAFGVDFKVPRTLRDLVVRPGRVADAALSGDRRSYTPPLRLFFAIFTVQTLLFGWVGADQTITLEATFAQSPEALAMIAMRLAELGSSVAAADEILRSWYNWMTWPITALSSFLYVLVIWAMRPSLGFFKSLMLFVVPLNASYVVALPLMLTGWLLGQAAFIAVSFVALVAYFVFSGLVLHRRSADTALGLATRLLVLMIATAPILVVIYALLIGAIELAFRQEIGTSWFGLIVAAGEASSAR
jgi:hypothetical protein